MRFKGKVIWITGASSGIGKQLALQLAQEQALLILTARNESALNIIKQECSPNTDKCTVLPTDLSHFNAIELVAEALAIHGHIDIVIHSAGISQRSLAINTGEEVYRELMEVNYFAPVNITLELLRHFSERKNGHIVALGSMAGLMGFPMRTGYAAAKHALKGFFETLQCEHNIEGLNITIVSLGRVNTPISENAITADGTPHGIKDKGQQNGIPVDVCANKILNAIEKKKKHIIIAQEEKVLSWLWWYARRYYYKIARRTGLSNR